MSTPTQIELATLAATYTGGGTPEARVQAALAIWKAAGEEIPSNPAYVGKKSRDLVKMADKYPLALDSVRRVYMPKMPQAKFTARWAGFIQWEMEHDRKGIHFLDGKHIMPGDKITPKQAKRLADDVLREQSENGVKAPMSTMDEFKKWDAESSAIERKKKAAKAGHAKWDKEKQNK